MRQCRIPPVGERIGETSQVVRGEFGCVVRGPAQREGGQIGDQVEIAEAQGLAESEEIIGRGSLAYGRVPRRLGQCLQALYFGAVLLDPDREGPRHRERNPVAGVHGPADCGVQLRTQ
jgi:hypothetical protein